MQKAGISSHIAFLLQTATYHPPVAGPRIIGKEPCPGDPQNLSGHKGPGATQNYPDTRTGSKFSPNLSGQVDRVPKNLRKASENHQKIAKNFFKPL